VIDPKNTNYIASLHNTSKAESILSFWNNIYRKEGISETKGLKVQNLLNDEPKELQASQKRNTRQALSC
jgi:hypothetical protein